MNWQKKGHIYVPDGNTSWASSYASVPVVDFIGQDKIRIYFTVRDENNRASITFVEADAGNPKNISYIHNKPILEAGMPGMFDDCGAMTSHIVNVGNEKWLYYIGWNVRNTIPYFNSIGLAKSKDGGITFEKFSEGPLFDRNYNEPYFSAAPFVMKEKEIWKMWYLSNTKWQLHDGVMEPFYHIKYAESQDGINWQRTGKVAIDFRNENECGIVRACVIKDADIYKMWYSHRNLNNYRNDKNNSYRIGYAESSNGIDWKRKDDEVGIDVSDSGWDSEMIEYPFIYDYDGERYMLYNGNTFGKSGFGYAVIE